MRSSDSRGASGRLLADAEQGLAGGLGLVPEIFEGEAASESSWGSASGLPGSVRARAEGHVVELLAELEADALRRLLAHAGHRPGGGGCRPSVMAVTSSSGDMPERTASAVMGPTPWTAMSLRKSAPLLAAEEAEEEDGVFADLRVDVQVHRVASRAWRRSRRARPRRSPRRRPPPPEPRAPSPAGGRAAWRSWPSLRAPSATSGSARRWPGRGRRRRRGAWERRRGRGWPSP